jgi:hypothetical protein
MVEEEGKNVEESATVAGQKRRSVAEDSAWRKTPRSEVSGAASGRQKDDGSEQIMPRYKYLGGVR